MTTEELLCPVCNEDYAECPCPGPSMDDEYEYKELDGVLMARRRTQVQGATASG